MRTSKDSSRFSASMGWQVRRGAPASAAIGATLLLSLHRCFFHRSSCGIETTTPIGGGPTTRGFTQVSTLLVGISYVTSWRMLPDSATSLCLIGTAGGPPRLADSLHGWLAGRTDTWLARRYNEGCACACCPVRSCACGLAGATRSVRPTVIVRRSLCRDTLCTGSTLFAAGKHEAD